MALDCAEGAALPRPDDADTEAPQMEIEFEVSTFRPRRIRLRTGDGDSAAPEIRIAHEAEGNGVGAGDDPRTRVILWAYYEACRSGAAHGGKRLPWEHPRNRRVWRAFREAMLAEADSDQWWADPAELLARARRAYRTCNQGF